MALLSYCIILYLVMTIDCAAIDENTTGENNDSNTNRKRALQGCEHSLCILEGSTCLQEEYNDRFASQLCEMNQNKRARTDSGTWTYPYSTESLSEQVMANNNSFCVSSAMNMPIQPTEIIYGNNPQSSSGCETYFSCNPASTCTLLQTQWNQAPCDYRQANSCETSNFCNLSRTNYASQIDTQRNTNLNLLSKDEHSVSGLAYSNLIQPTTSSEYLAPEVTDLPSHATRHNVSSDQSRLSNPLRTDTNKFNQLLKWYQLEKECIKQSFGESKFKFRIISNDVLQFLILQATPLDKNHNQTVSHVSVSLPDFEYYYERCKESLSSKTKFNIIFSQKWSGLAERRADFMMYTDFAGRIADLKSTLSKDQCIKRIKKFSTKFCLGIVFVPSPAHDVKDNHYNPEDNFLCPVIARDVVNSYISIDTEKYTLDNALDYFAEFAIFKQFVFDTFFSKHPSQVFHTIKEELWKLQVFISEIYLYLTWRLTITKDITVYEGPKKYGLKEEIKNLASLVDAFYKHSRPEILPSITLEALQDTVKKLRLDVLAMLKCHFGESAMYQFYKIAHDPPVTSRYKNVHMRNRDILSMLAFAPKLPFCEASSQYIYKRNMNLETNVDHFELGKFTHDHIGRNVPRKVEVTKILIATVKFIRELKPKTTLSNEEKNCVIIFRYFAVLLSPGTDKQSLKVKFLSNCGFYVYFHRLLSELFAY